MVMGVRLRGSSPGGCAVGLTGLGCGGNPGFYPGLLCFSPLGKLGLMELFGPLNTLDIRKGGGGWRLETGVMMWLGLARF